jgi:hypothetical protein
MHRLQAIYVDLSHFKWYADLYLFVRSLACPATGCWSSAAAREYCGMVWVVDRLSYSGTYCSVGLLRSFYSFNCFSRCL